jgi:c-di-GMP-binding flagellar brake protein YcgR
MLQEVLSIGDKIDIKPIGRNGKPVAGARTYVSQLVDFVDPDVINIAAPIVLGRTIPLQVGESFNLCFYTEKGLYRCNALVLSNHRENKTIITVVRITTNLEKFQRREYYRLECIYDIEYRSIPLEEQILEKKLKDNNYRNAEERAEISMKLQEMDKEWKTASITDISGGGAKFTSESPLHNGDKIRMRLSFINSPGNKNMIICALVIATGRILTRTGVHEHRVQFDSIPQKDREVLIKYIFEQERKRMRNDKG